ncbi:hypothetical protein [Flavobacterium sp. UMI-01]|uniref:hypothetical protein n=1 Tax=Flavobacterium sp. UMI-01 TaxID=1441053 RepID=UPI001C7D9E14|nr:hypothetical protein [Flavobacterium sp. UMI-01]GIZ08034.1 hypothetical protein FUMI01_07610 [Flavobacterium sp. UMI-01]
MKKLFFILTVSLFFSCKSKKVVTTTLPINEQTEETTKEAENALEEKPAAPYVKLNLNAVKSAQKLKAYELGKRLLNTCNTSKFKPYTTAEATPSVINNITIDAISKICTRYRQYYGEFIDLKLAEIYQLTDDQTTVYRYKALYSKKVANKELRVYMDTTNRMSAIKTMDWENQYVVKRK